MINIQKIILNDNDHGLLGCGEISYTYQHGNGEKALTIFFKLLNKTIIYNGGEAEKIYKRIIGDGESSTIIILKRLATESCNIPLFRIKQKSREEAIVFSKYLIYYYLNKYMDYSPAKCSKIFGQDRATIYHGVDIIKSDPKYLKQDQRLWRKTFMNKLIENKLIS